MTYIWDYLRGLVEVFGKGEGLTHVQIKYWWQNMGTHNISLSAQIRIEF